MPEDTTRLPPPSEFEHRIILKDSSKVHYVPPIPLPAPHKEWLQKIYDARVSSGCASVAVNCPYASRAFVIPKKVPDGRDTVQAWVHKQKKEPKKRKRKKTKEKELGLGLPVTCRMRKRRDVAPSSTLGVLVSSGGAARLAAPIVPSISLPTRSAAIDR